MVDLFPPSPVPLPLLSPIISSLLRQLHNSLKERFNWISSEGDVRLTKQKNSLAGHASIWVLRLLPTDSDPNNLSET